MALTELQLPTKTELYNAIQSVAGESASRMARWRFFADFLATLTATDLDAIGVPATGTIRAELVEFRTALNQIIAFFDGDSTTQTVVPKDVMDKLRKMMII